MIKFLNYKHQQDMDLLFRIIIYQVSLEILLPTSSSCLITLINSDVNKLASTKCNFKVECNGFTFAA